MIQLSNTGSDRASAYITSNKIVRHNGLIYAGWLDAPGGPGQLAPIRLAIWEEETGKMVADHVLGKAYDNHCGPALAMESTGRLHVMIGAHHNPLLYRWSDDPLNLESWSEPVALGPFATYPSLVVDSQGTLHLLHRHMDERWQLWYRRKPRNAEWEQWVVLAQSPLPGYNHFYQSLVVGPDDSLHVLFQFCYSETGRSADAKSRSVVSLQSTDRGESWVHAGVRLESPLVPENTTPILHYPEGGIRISNLVVDQKRQAWFFANFPEPPYAALYCHDGNGWAVRDVAELLASVSFEGGRESSLSLDRNGCLHLVTATMPKGKSTWYDSGHEIYRAVFSRERKLLSLQQISPQDPSSASWLPALEHWDWTRPDECCFPQPALLYTKGGTAGKGNNTNTLCSRVMLTL